MSMNWYIKQYQDTLPERVLEEMLGFDQVVTVIIMSDVYNVEPTPVKVRKVGLSIDEDCETQLVFTFFGDREKYIAYWTTKGWAANFV